MESDLEAAGSRAIGISANKMSWFGEPAKIDTSEEFVKVSLSGKAIHDLKDGFFSKNLAGIADVPALKEQNGPVEILIAQAKTFFRFRTRLKNSH